MSRREAEILLSGGQAGHDLDPLGSVLAAAAGRPLPHELRDRDVVVGAFVRAALDSDPRPVRVAGRPVLGLLARALPVKVAAILAVVLLGGVAVAAEKGVLPRPIQSAAHDILSGVGVPPANNQEPGDPEDDGDHKPTATPGTQRSEDATEELQKLCREYQAAQRGREEFDREDLATLAKAAGGESRVAAFCDQHAEPTPSTDDGGSTATASPVATPDGESGDQNSGSGNGGGN